MDSKKRSIVVALVLAMFLGAVEGTVVTTAAPTIVKELHGFALISWVFSLYLLTSAVSTPIYGKLADLYGRKNVLTIGIVIFLVGSFLCGLSQSILQLVCFRALQGLGAGAIFTVSYTIVGDIFTLGERSRVQGWISSVWGIASLLGPFLGGFLIDFLSWHWIFFINIPFGILAVILLQKNLTEAFEHKKHRIDYLGTAALSAAIMALLYAVLTGFLVPLVLAAGFALLFFYVERKAEEPIVPFEIFTKDNATANIISFMSSAILMGIDVYIPLYIQNVLGYSAIVSGLSMAPMSAAWLLTTIMLAKAIPRLGERVITVLSSLIVLLCCLLLLLLNTGSSLVLAAVIVLVSGFGFGGGFTTLTIFIQNMVGYDKRGAATASNSLVRTIGQTIGISIFGSIFNLNIIKYFDRIGIHGVDPNNLYSQQNTISILTSEHIKASQNSSLHVIFIVLIIAAAICIPFSFRLPESLKERVPSD